MHGDTRIYAHERIFHKCHVQTKESQGSCMNRSQVHSTKNDAKLLRLGHDPSQNLIKIC